MVAVLQNIHSLLPLIPPMMPSFPPASISIFYSFSLPFFSIPPSLIISLPISNHSSFFSLTFLTSHIHSTIGESEEEREQLLPSNSPDQRGVERQIRRRRGMMMGQEIKGLGRRGEERKDG